MSSQTSSVPSILADLTVFLSEAAFYGKCIIRIASPGDLSAIAAYGKVIAEKGQIDREVQVAFYRALGHVQSDGLLPGYEKTVQQLKDYPDRYGEFEELIAQYVHQHTRRDKS